MPAYLNSASHGPPSERTLQRIRSHIDLERDVGPAAAFERVRDEYHQVRCNAASLIGAVSNDVGFAPTTSAAWLPLVVRFRLSGKRLLVAPHEWGDNVRALEAIAANTGAVIEVLPELDFAAPDLQSWEDRIGDDVAAIFVPMVSSVSGLRYPVEDIGRLPRPDPCRFVVDAAQALGQTPIDVSQLSCDALVATCRKWLRGPRGTALFWTNPELGDALAASELEPYDANVSLRLGVGNAISEALDAGVGELEKEIRTLRDHTYRQVTGLGFDGQTDSPPMTGAICIGLPRRLAARAGEHLANRGVVVKFPDARRDEPCARTGAADLVPMRISPSYFNTEREISELVSCLSDLV